MLRYSRERCFPGAGIGVPALYAAAVRVGPDGPLVGRAPLQPRAERPGGDAPDPSHWPGSNLRVRMILRKVVAKLFSRNVFISEMEIFFEFGS